MFKQIYMKGLYVFFPIILLSLPVYFCMGQETNAISTAYGSSYGIFVTDKQQKADVKLQSINVELLPENCRTHFKCVYQVSCDSIPSKIMMGISFRPDKITNTTGKAIRMRNEMILDSCSVSIDGNKLSKTDISMSKEYLKGCNEIDSLQAIIDSLFNESRKTTISYNPNYDTSHYSETMDRIFLKLSNMMKSTPYITWNCILDTNKVNNVDVQWTTPFGIELSGEHGNRNLFFLSLNLPDNAFWNGVSDSTYIEIDWGRFSDMVIDETSPGSYTMEDNHIRWYVKELDLNRIKQIRILFHSSDTMPERILKSHEFPGFRYDPIPYVPTKLLLPSL